MANYTLDSIVKEYTIEVGGSDMNKYPRYYQYGVSGIRELNMNSSGVVKSVELCIEGNSTCNLPPDYLQYKTIGLLGADCRIHSIGRNDTLSLSGCCAPTQNWGVNSFGMINNFDSNYRNGEFMGRMFGVNGGVNGYGQFRIDVENQIILLSDLAPLSTSIVLEYLADIESVDGDFIVHPFIIEALKAFIYWKSIQRDRNRSIGEKEQAKNDYNVAAKWAKKRFTASTIQEYLEAFRSGNTASVKF
jgi:hypothetical protein